MEPWKWLVFGLLLLVVEALNLGGFYLLFFGAGAVLTGIVILLFPSLVLSLQVTLFLLVSVLSALFLRRPLLEQFRSLRPSRKVENIAGEPALSLTAMDVGEDGKAELRGTVWSARNIGDRRLGAHERCIVDRVEGLMLCIRPR